jgi:DNA processing protein
VGRPVDEEVLLARAFLNRVAEPASIPLWNAVRCDGPVETVRAIQAGRAPADVAEATAARAERINPYADLDAAQRRGIRLVVPESDEWPHFAFSALEAAGERRLRRYLGGDHSRSESGELVPPLALWIRGTGDLATVGVRSIAMVGARNATDYGERVAKELAYELAMRDFVVVSGGAYGIDAAAHRGTLAANGATVLVSAGGLDRPYPRGNADLFERIAESGLLVSESPPGSDPRRHRFLTRNRLIAALGTGTLVVEAASRSGARNTARHCIVLGRPLMAVPGPITSAMSAGCHRLLAAEQDRAELVTGVNDVLAVVGSPRDVLIESEPEHRDAIELRDRLDVLDPTARRVFDGFPARGWIDPDRLAVATGLPPLGVLRSLPLLELSGLVETSPEGYRIARPKKRRPP